MLQFDLVEVDVKLSNNFSCCQFQFGFPKILIFTLSTFVTSHSIQTRVELCPILVFCHKIVFWCCYCYWISTSDINFTKVPKTTSSNELVLQSHQAAARRKTQCVHISVCMVYILLYMLYIHVYIQHQHVYIYIVHTYVFSIYMCITSPTSSS